jgi:hypothetical protein
MFVLIQGYQHVRYWPASAIRGGSCSGSSMRDQQQRCVGSRVDHERQRQGGFFACVETRNRHNDETANRRCFAFIDGPTDSRSMPLIPGRQRRQRISVDMVVIIEITETRLASGFFHFTVLLNLFLYSETVAFPLNTLTLA